MNCSDPECEMQWYCLFDNDHEIISTQHAFTPEDAIVQCEELTDKTVAYVEIDDR